MDLALEAGHREMWHSAFPEFQSLFLWILLSKAASTHKPVRLCQFQSLFLWILLSKQPLRAAASRLDAVSILVFMDLALEAAEGHGHRLILLSFNPCFYGSCSRSLMLTMGLAAA